MFSLGCLFFMQIQIPSEFGEGDVGFMLRILDEMLHPRSGTVCLSQQYINELEKRQGYLLLLMVPGCTGLVTSRKLCIIHRHS